LFFAEPCGHTIEKPDFSQASSKELDETMRKAYFRAFHLRPKVGAFKRISRKKWFAGVGNMYSLNRLNPGVSKDGYIVFDVPKNFHYKLKLSDRYRTNSYALIKIKPE